MDLKLFESLRKVKLNEISLQGYMPAGVTYDDIVKVFGEPNGTGDGYKIDVKWEGNINGKKFTIYNYKTGRNYLGADAPDYRDLTGEDWHIGAEGNWDSPEGKKVVAAVIAKLKKGK